MRYAVLPLLTLMASGCGGRQRVDQAPSGGGSPTTSAQVSRQGPATAVAGAWAMRALNRDRSRQLQLVLDSANGESFKARVGFLMQGDVGIDPEGFVSTPGTVTAEGVIRIEITNRRGAPPGLIVGRVAGDTIRVTEFRWGGDDQLTGGTQWILVRER
ncbi:MAG TPA: hypothetical protein VD793_02005 [Gemmatimonadales bacterium]|nr:hypothetical protein [Gemmatimonadales bacterium]